LPQIQDSKTKVLIEALVIDDDEDDVFLLTRALRDAAAKRCAEISLQRATNGVDGLNFVSRSDLLCRLPDLVVVDLNMPLLNGVGFLHALRTALELHVVWTVVLTTSDQPEILGAAREAGADEVFVKPQSQQELATIAARMLDGALRVRSR